jgi:hypothetical protein
MRRNTAKSNRQANNIRKFRKLVKCGAELAQIPNYRLLMAPYTPPTLQPRGLERR